MLYGSMAPNHEDLVVHEQGFFAYHPSFSDEGFFCFSFCFLFERALWDFAAGKVVPLERSRMDCADVKIQINYIRRTCIRLS